MGFGPEGTGLGATMAPSLDSSIAAGGGEWMTDIGSMGMPRDGGVRGCGAGAG